MKKSLQRAILIGVIVLAILFAPLLNDLKAEFLEHRYENLDLPAGTERVAVASFIGNTAGTGDRTEILVGMLVTTDQSFASLGSNFSGYEVLSASDFKSEYWVEEEMFPELEENHYVIYNIYPPLTHLDIRGH